jgi:hypothetical protein
LKKQSILYLQLLYITMPGSAAVVLHTSAGCDVTAARVQYGLTIALAVSHLLTDAVALASSEVRLLMQQDA